MAGIVPFRAPVDLAPLKAFREFAALLAHGHQFTAEARIILIGAHEFRFEFFGFGTEGHKFINTGRYCMASRLFLESLALSPPEPFSPYLRVKPPDRAEKRPQIVFPLFIQIVLKSPLMNIQMTRKISLRT